MSSKHVVIVGAGPGGLTSAMLLAHRGCRVTVFEKEPVVGGRNAAITEAGYTWDTGPTFLMMSYILKEMFQETGRKVEDYLHFTALDPLYRLVLGDMDFRPSPDAAKMRARIAEAFPGNETGLDRFLTKERTRYERLFPCLQKDYSSLRAFLDPIFLKAAPQLGLGRSLFDNLGRYFAPDRLKLCFTFQAKYLGMSPWQCPALFTMLSFIEHAFGILHVRGGLNKISEAMAKVAREEGAEIHLGAPVRKLLLEGRRVVGVEMESGGKVAADAVFVNADFGHAMKTLVPPGVLRKYAPERLGRLKVSCSTFMLYLGVKKRYDHLPHHSILFADDYRRNITEVADRLVLSADPSIYVQNASPTDPTLAPEGCSTIYILVPVPNNRGRIDWAREGDAFRDRVLELAERRGGYAGLRESIAVERRTTPADWENSHGVFEGATFNLAHNFGQLLYFRPHNRFQELENCWLVGGGTHPGSGLPTIYESARISANSFCRAFGLGYSVPSSVGNKELVRPEPPV
ncbi:MAG TPA: phytoene desaturase family protein [Planctomycetota bacterium]|nr:phytoene desaturase family protein [Planctomycetota bacterium]